MNEVYEFKYLGIYCKHSVPCMLVTLYNNGDLRASNRYITIDILVFCATDDYIYTNLTNY